jgi:3-isopropylmalate dehydrogenase
VPDFRLVLLPGDGIGPEVVDAAVLVLRTAADRFEFTVACETHVLGAAGLRRGLPPLPAETLEACRSADAILLGAVGDPEFDRAPRERKPETGLLQLRKALDLYANLRPAKVWPGLEPAGPFKPEVVSGVDMLIVRELSSGLYYGEPRGFDATRESAANTMRYTRDEVARVARVAFDAARRRRGKLTSVDKANVLEVSQLWREAVEAVAPAFAGVQLDHLYVDAASMLLVLEPARFDVVVAENLFGDILSDEAGAIAGSLGLLPSASLGEGPGLYEPVHGSAPSLAGRDVANPIGAIASAAMLLKYSLKQDAAADAIEAAIGDALAYGLRTADLVRTGGRQVGCRAMAEAIAERVAVGSAAR